MPFSLSSEGALKPMTTQYILAGWLIDGGGGPPRKSAMLKIDDGIIREVSDFDPHNPHEPASFTDMSFATIVPPFIDCHVHLAFSGSTDPGTRKQQAEAEFEEVRPIIRRHILYLFRHGVLAVRDAGDRGGYTLRYADHPVAAPEEPLIVKASGMAWHQQGHYGKMIGSTPAEGETLVEAFSRQTARGDLVKLINSGPNSLHEFARETQPQFSVAEIQQIVAMAAITGRKVMVHANGKLPVRLALEAGCHSIEHGYFMGRENLQLMAEKGTVLVPTLYAMKACSELADTAEARKIAARNLAHQLEQVALAREIGVKVALGTDSGSPGVLHGESVAEELKLFVKAGYSLAGAIHCATAAGAELLGVDAGLLTAGRPAHFLVARGTPAQLPRKFSYLEAIYLDGKPSSFYRKNPIRGVF
jgi:imidazolonepropionase-like amidohydrolase